MDVGAVDHRIGVAKAGAEGLADRKAPDHAGVDRVHHDQLVGEHGAAARVLAHAQCVQGGKGVGAELDAGADLADLAGLLQQRDAQAQPGQRQRRGQAADAAADHQQVLWFSHAISCVLSNQ